MTVASLPFIHIEGVFRDDNWFVGSLSLASCLLRPICRSLYRRSLPLLAFQVRAAGWCFLFGVVAAIVPDILIAGLHEMNWAGAVVNTLQCLVMLILWCNLYFSIKQWRQAAADRERLLRAEAEAREARLSALRYQLNPHFLFNSLNAVSTLVLEGNATAATRMLAQIGDLLRTSLDNEVVAEVPLVQEISFTEQYLAIEQTRLGEKLRVAMSISPETLEALVPNMLLQPLVENAVRHGVAPLLEGGTIAIQSSLDNGHLRIVIRNSATNSDHALDDDKPATGIGLTNTAARLKTLYGTDQSLALDWPEPAVCQATVELPFRKCP
ncbi:MAG TPA: histidine kinase [Blastocatellia bacterium]|nr:histidine kinase [Blastocatellia bacterium]